MCSMKHWSLGLDKIKIKKIFEFLMLLWEFYSYSNLIL